MKRVTGLGGIFFKEKEPENLKKWRPEHLCIIPGSGGSVTFGQREKNNPQRTCYTVWGHCNGKAIK